MEYVVFKSGGKQYRAKIGDVLEVDKIPGEVNKDVVLSDVLLWVSDGQIKVGKPLVDGAKVRALVLEQKKGEKIRVAKFKAKSRYRKVTGFRALKTSLRMESFDISGVKAKTPTRKEVKTTPKTSRVSKK